MTRFFRFLTTVLVLTSATAAGSADPIGAKAIHVVPGIDIAPIALLTDLNSGQILFQRDADRRFIPASMTKVMTLYVAFELIDEGKLSPRQTFTVRPETFAEWHNKGSRMFLPKDARVTVDDLLMGIASVSANDGAVVLGEGAVGSVGKWVALMNDSARELGMRNTRFGTPNGWPDQGQTYTTARDLVTLAQAIISEHPTKYARYFGQAGFAYNGIAQSNHDPMIGIVPGADGLKTGFTNEAGYGFLGSAKRNGRRMALVIAASDSSLHRKTAARELIEWGFDSFAAQKLFDRGEQVGSAAVQDGASSTVALLAPGPISATLPHGEGHEVTLTIRYEGPLQAPVAAGERIAELEIAVDGLPSSRVPLVTASDVPQAGLFKRLFNGIAGLVT